MNQIEDLKIIISRIIDMVTAELNQITMTFETHSGLFSPQAIDVGTRAMLSCVQFLEGDKILDLGCGYGIVGIYAAKLTGQENVTMLDIDETAIRFAKKCRAKWGAGCIYLSK